MKSGQLAAERAVCDDLNGISAKSHQQATKSAMIREVIRSHTALRKRRAAGARWEN